MEWSHISAALLTASLVGAALSAQQVDRTDNGPGSTQRGDGEPVAAPPPPPLIQGGTLVGGSFSIPVDPIDPIDPCQVVYGPRTLDPPVQVATAPADVSSLALDAAKDRLVLHYVVGETPGDAPSALNISYSSGSPEGITIVAPPPPGDPLDAELRDSDASVCTTPGGVDFGGAIFSSPGGGFSFVEFYDRPEDTTVQTALPKIVAAKSAGFVETVAMVGHEYNDGIKVHTFQLVDPDGTRSSRKAVWVRYDDADGGALGSFVEANGAQNPSFDASLIDLAVGDQGRLCLAWSEARGGLGGNPYVARVAISENGSEPTGATTLSESGVESLLVRTEGNLVVAAWSRDQGQGQDVIEVATLDTAGDSWSSPVVVTTDPGLDVEDLRFDILPNGRVFLAWVDNRNGEFGVYTACSDDNGSTWSEPLFHDCGTELKLSAANDASGAVGIIWETATPTTQIAATLSKDFGSSWEVPFLVSDGVNEAGEAVIVYEELYGRFAMGCSSDVGGTVQPILGGFRPATTTPTGWGIGVTSIGYNFAGFGATDDLAIALTSLSVGSYALPDGRNVGIVPDALSLIVLSSFGGFSTALAPGGAGSSAEVPIDLPPSGAGLTFYTVGIGVDLGTGAITSITSVTPETLL